MTVDEKRKKLDAFCNGRRCGGCPLKSPVCRCGCGYYFTYDLGDSAYMTDDEINAAYAVVFPEVVTGIMTSERFNEETQKQIQRSIDTLCKKATEYATEDRLHNFKVAASLEQVTPIQALAGMMAKHTVSVYDMCISGKDYPISLWEEKITDHINYLLLLNAMVREHEGTDEG